MTDRFRIEFGGRSVELPRGELLVGRDEDCHIRFTSPSVSRCHLRILAVGGVVVGYDLDSSNGTFVNGARLAGPVELGDGDRVRVGDESFVITRVPSETSWADSPKTEPRGRPFAYSTPKYRTCRHCLSLVHEDEESCPECRRGTLPPPPGGAEPRDRRAAPRMPIDAQALYVSPTLTFDGRLTEISASGLFVASDLVDPAGTRADVVLFCLSAGGARFGGEVARVVPTGAADATPGMGIRFTDVEPAARRWLDHYLVEHAQPLGADRCNDPDEGPT